ncbi:MAG TPA: Rieske 2Fe-2S domain-containing protein [Hyphomicrobiaceae bacterium]|jgi:phenylpropionate dioxygenase-like ring-hydroxylating dioxygenase large terminal subunit
MSLADPKPAAIEKAIDTGTGYGRKAAGFNADWTLVGPGTKMGELLRRYWHPVGLSSHATDTPRQVRALGEDLILFRDKTGRPGLVHARCAHRGTTLYYGRVEERGIRCCYHGWLFDVEGRCLEQPCEPDGGRRRDRVRQPWYPVREQYGLVFAYMGPPERKPVLPRYRCLEELEEAEFLETNDTSIGGGGPTIIPCNWFQHYDNLPDTFHVYVLHTTFSGVQFVNDMGILPEVSWHLTDKGVKTVSIRKLDDGRIFRRVSEAVLPTLRIIPNPKVGRYGRVESIGWVLPIDDASFRIYTAARVREPGELARSRSRLNGKLWEELTEEEHRRFPGDYEAMVGQGPITLHDEEHLATTDTGIVMLRRFFQRQLDAVAAGRDPVGVVFDESKAMVDFEAGNYLE